MVPLKVSRSLFELELRSIELAALAAVSVPFTLENERTVVAPLANVPFPDPVRVVLGFETEVAVKVRLFVPVFDPVKVYRTALLLFVVKVVVTDPVAMNVVKPLIDEMTLTDVL